MHGMHAYGMHACAYTNDMTSIMQAGTGQGVISAMLHTQLLVRGAGKEEVRIPQLIFAPCHA